MRWLIVEDALSDRKGHWAEYVATLLRGLEVLGDHVTILCDKNAESFILESFNARPLLPKSIWHRMGDSAGALKRYLRVPLHALATWYAILQYLRNPFGLWEKKCNNQGVTPDVIFVPTVLVHHLLGWYLILITGVLSKGTNVLLFFPNLPLRIDKCGNASWINSPTTRLMIWLFERIRPLVETRGIILGVETEQMRMALGSLIGLPVIYLPHPVEPLAEHYDVRLHSPLYFAAYGAARAEKGSSLYQDAIVKYLSSFPEDPTRFAIQWIDDFLDTNAHRRTLPCELYNSPKVDVIRHLFQDEEYAERLSSTSALVLPYKASSYALRVSRVVIEAMVNGIPVITTVGTTLCDQVGKYGAGLSCTDDVDSLFHAIRDMVDKYPKYFEAAQSSKIGARDHFSVHCFRQILLDHLGEVPFSNRLHSIRATYTSLD